MLQEGITVSFDEIASSYDCWYTTSLGRFADEAETALAFVLFAVRPGELILDAACGTGNFSLKLARKGAQVVGVDLAPGMLAVAQEKAVREGLPVSLVQADLCCLPYPANHFDGVICMAAFEFIPEPQTAFNELIRVLKPGGSLLIGTINRESVWGALYKEQAQKGDSIYRRARFMSLKELIDLDRANLERTGQCLFVNPDSSAEHFKQEEKARLGGRGGFVAALWRKPPTAKD